jgi:hypothetical protein
MLRFFHFANCLFPFFDFLLVLCYLCLRHLKLVQHFLVVFSLCALSGSEKIVQLTKFAFQVGQLVLKAAYLCCLLFLVRCQLANAIIVMRLVIEHDLA